MAEKFDPYHAWLGIPKWDQPANAYRLLGVEIFEKNRKVIEAAANRQMAYLQELSTGDDVELAQKLLGEVSRARVVLLNPEKKKAYDKKLSAQIDALSEAKDESRPPAVPPSRSSAARPVTKKEKSLNRLTPLRTVLLAVVGLLAIVIALLVRPKPLEVQLYDDTNKNGQFDPGEGVEDLEFDKVQLEGATPRGSLLTDQEGVVHFNFPSGAYKLTVAGNSRSFYEVDGGTKNKNDNDGEPYVEVEVGGSRLFAQNIQISVKKKLRKKPPPKSKQVVGESQPPRSQKPRITIRGQIFHKNASGEKEGLNDLGLFLDLDGDEIYLNRTEPWCNSAKDGNFIFSHYFAEGDEAAVGFRQKLPYWYRDPGPIPVPLADAKEGTIVVPIELKRKLVSVQGTLSVLPEGESAEGFIVYMDRNENDQPDEDEPKTETDAQGNHQWEFEHFDDFHPNKLKIQPAEGEYSSAVSQRGTKIHRNKSPIMITDADFKIVKNPPDKPPEGDPTGTEEKTAKNEGDAETNGEGENQKEEPHVVIADPETDPDGFLRQLGFEPAPGGAVDKDNKPIWIFKVDPDLLPTFIKNKKTYSTNAIKGKWDTQIPALESEIKRIDAVIEKIFSDAKTKTAKDRAVQKAEPWDKRNKTLHEQLEPLLNARNQSLIPLIEAAKLVVEQRTRLQAVIDQEEDAQKAAELLGVSLDPEGSKAIKMVGKWRPAAKFLAEQRLLALGLSRGKRGWVPEGVKQMWELQKQLKRARGVFTQYLQMKKEVLKLIQSGAQQYQIDPIEKKVDSQRLTSNFKNAQGTFNSIANQYLNLLSQLQSQRTELETKKDELEPALKLAGGNYKTVIGHYPTSDFVEQENKAVSAFQRDIQ